MDTQKYREATEVCDRIAARTQDQAIMSLTDRMHRALEQEHKPTMALVSFNMNHSERFDIVKNYAGVEVPAELAAMVEGKPACIMLDYQKKPTLLSNGDIIVYGLPSDKLKAHRIAICDEIKARDRWLDLTAEIDIACLLVNATMAMNQIERTWLQECGQPLFHENQPVLAMVGMHLLNNEEDAQAVSAAVDAGLKRLQMHTKVFDQPSEAMLWMADFMNGAPIAESHHRRVVKNSLTAVGERTVAYMNSAIVDGNAIDAAVAQLEKQRGSLEQAAQLAADSILLNELSKLRVMAIETIRDYGRKMADDIKSQVETYPLDQLSTLDQTVNQNASQAWNGFIASISATTESELQKVAAKLSEQMEADAGDLISRLDESTRQAVLSAITFNAAPGGPASPVRTPAEYSGIDVTEMTGKLRRETRNMMLLSIPLLLVNPWVAIGNVFVSKAIGKFRTDSELKVARADMAAQVDLMCTANAENMVRYTESSFDRQMQEGAQAIRQAYGGLLRQMEADLNRMKSQQNQNAALKNYLTEQTRTVIPALLEQL